MENDPRTYAIIGAAMEVHRHLGCGFLEGVYQEALAIEFTVRGIPFKAQIEMPVFYKAAKLESKYKPDFICFENVIVELKAISETGRIEDAQVLNYLKVSGFEIGLLLNFGKPSLDYKRFIDSKKK
jgi:GxxExxY protein